MSTDVQLPHRYTGPALAVPAPTRFIARGDRVTIAHSTSPAVGTVMAVTSHGNPIVNWDVPPGSPQSVAVYSPVELAHAEPGNAQRYETTLASGRVVIRHAFPVGARIQRVADPGEKTTIQNVCIVHGTPRYQSSLGKLDIETTDRTWRLVDYPEARS